jgi:hypothetical protein
MRKPKFLTDCEAAAELIGEEIDRHLTWAAPTRKTSAYEDDGCLHVEKAGLHVCIGIGQDRPLKEQNERMHKVLKHLGLLKFSNKCLHSNRDVEMEEEESERGMTT